MNEVPIEEYYAKKGGMHHLGEDVVNRAVRFDRGIGAYVKHLDMFGVCGIIGIPLFHKILNYIKGEKDRGFLEVQIAHYERKGLIWCPDTIGEALDRQFMGAGPKKPRDSKYVARYQDGL